MHDLMDLWREFRLVVKMKDFEPSYVVSSCAAVNSFSTFSYITKSQPKIMHQ